MSASDRTRIYIPPKVRGRLPWRYRDRKPMRGDRWVALLLSVGALFWLCMWLALKR